MILLAGFKLIGTGSSLMYIAGVTTCVKNFTGRRGLALPVAIVALAAGTYSRREEKTKERMRSSLNLRLPDPQTLIFTTT
jgi:hypothetical protein